MKYIKKLLIFSFIVSQFFFVHAELQNKISEKIGTGFISFLEKTVKDGKELHLKNIPFLKKLPVPAPLKTIFEETSITTKKFQKKESGHYSVAGQANLFGSTVMADLLIKKKINKNLYSLRLQMPIFWKITDIFPDLKKLDLLHLEKVFLTISSDNYKDSSGRKIKKGINLEGIVKPSSEIIKKINPIFGNKLDKTVLKIEGALGLPRGIGSVLNINIPVSIMVTEKIGFSPMKLGIAVEENVSQVPVLSVFGQGGMRVLFPRHKNPVDFGLQMKLTLEPLVAKFLAKMDGWIEIIPGLTLGQFKIGFVSDLALALETAFVGSISGLTIGAGSGYGESKVWFTASGALSGTTGIGDLTLIGKGDWRLNDVVGFWLGWAYRGVNLTRFIKKENILIGKTKQIKDKILQKLPNLKFGDVELSFVPKQTIDEQKRVVIKVGRFQLLNQSASGKLYVSKEGVVGKFNLKPMLIGPKNKPFIIVSDIDNKEGLSFDLNITKDIQNIAFNCMVETPLFGGIKRGAAMNLSTRGLELKGTQKVFGTFESEFEIKAKIDKGKIEDNFSISLKMKQDALEKLSKLCSNIAENILKNSQEKIKFTEKFMQKNIDEWAEKRDANVDKKIKEIKSKIERIKSYCDRKHKFKTTQNLCYFYGGMVDEKIKLQRFYGRKKISTSVIKSISKAGVKVSSKSAQIASYTAEKALKLVGKIADKGFNISYLEASGNLKDFSKGKPLKVVKFIATVMGKKIELTDFELKIKDIPTFIVNLVKEALNKEI